MDELQRAYAGIRERIARAAGDRPVVLLAVSKQQPAEAVRALAGLGHRAFGENYVQEARAKQAGLADLDLCWHLIGPLQSNKCAEAAVAFDWIDSIDRAKIIPLLARFRGDRPPLQVLIQVNIDDEASKSGCAPDEVPALADLVRAHPQLVLRGLMAIPAPGDMETRRLAFRRMAALFRQLRDRHPGVDTLSLGMSDDFEVAIDEGANLVRVGSALFGARKRA